MRWIWRGSRPGKLELVQQPFDPSQLAQELADFMHPIAEARGLRFHYRNQLPAHLVVLGGATRVRQILINLLGNAIKFAERGEVALLITQHGDNLRFKVRDSGPGIGPEQHKRLFQRFEQSEGTPTSSRYRGSGLGLAISQELTVAMKGKIRVRSRLGMSTQFTVDLPLPLDRSGVRIASGQVQMLAGESLGILLVEDDPIVAEVICVLLIGRGHRLVHAAHGLAALSEAVDGGTVDGGTEVTRARDGCSMRSIAKVAAARVASTGRGPHYASKGNKNACCNPNVSPHACWRPL